MTDITDNIIKQRKRILSPSLSLSYNEPLHIIRGRRQYLYDADGNEFLDATNNIQHVGHCHPKVIEATLRQLKKLNTNTRYLDKTILDYASLLIQKMPNKLNKVFLQIQEASQTIWLCDLLEIIYKAMKQSFLMEHTMVI